MNEPRTTDAFSLTEVVLALGVVSFAVLATFGLLSVGNSTGRDARDQQLAARLATNEFNRLRTLSASNSPLTATPAPSYVSRYYDSGLSDLGKVTDFGATPPPTAAYKISINFVAPLPSPGPADWIANAEIAYPALAPTANQTIARFTTLMDTPIATPATPTPTP